MILYYIVLFYITSLCIQLLLQIVILHILCRSVFYIHTGNGINGNDGLCYGQDNDSLCVITRWTQSVSLVYTYGFILRKMTNIDQIKCFLGNVIYVALVRDIFS